MTPPVVSIIIVNYNTSRLVNDCIRSIFEQVTDIPYEIIVVDNATEPLSSVIEAAGDPRLTLLQLPENVGFGLGNNAGAELARGRYLFLLNPDTILLNNAVRILSDYLDSHPTTGICGGNLYDRDLNPNFSFSHLTPGLIHELNDLMRNIPLRLRYGKDMYFNATGSPMDVPVITGANMMIRARLFRQIGGFSSDFFLYYEDTDLCRRVRNEGYAITSVPEARIIHLEGGSADLKPINPVTINREERGRAVYLRRHASLLHRLLAHPVHLSIYTLGGLLSRNPFFRLKLRAAINAIFRS